MRTLILSIIFSTLSSISLASEFGDYCYSQEHNLKQNHTLRALFMQFDVGHCLEVESLISKTSRLDLSHAQISEVKPFQHMNSVVYLDLSNNRISDISDLARAHHLESLDLSNNDIYDFAPLIYLTSLTQLNISNNPINKNEHNCPTDSNNKALTFACFNIDAFESEFHESDNQTITLSQFEHALSQIFEGQSLSFNEVVNLNAFHVTNMKSLTLNIKGRTFDITNNADAPYALKINVMQSDDLLKIEFFSPSKNGIARFEKTNGQFKIMNIE